MLIKCKECGHDVSDQAVSCPKCGYPIKFRNNKRVTKSFKRNPNKFGQIRKLSGNRRNPYAVYPPVTEYKENGTPVSRPAIGYYPTYQEAQLALVKYNENPYISKRVTFKEVYDLWFNSTFGNPNIETNKHTERGYTQGIKYLNQIWKKEIGTIKTQNIQDILDCGEYTYNQIARMISVSRKVFAFAMQNDIVEKDYSIHLVNNAKSETQSGIPFYEEELKILKSHTDDADVKFVLCLIYTGLRKSETLNMNINLEENYMQGGMKTKAGKNRIIPIHPAIRKWIEEGIFSRYTGSSSINSMFDRCIKKYGIERTADGIKHTPHDCRHTFSWLCDKYGVDSVAKHKIMGHALGDVEVDVYGHRKIEELQKEINKICY